LRKKGISREIIGEVLQNIDPEDSALTAVNLLEKKYKYRSLEELESKMQKMYSFLLSKGYNFETSRKAVDDYLNKEERLIYLILTY
jgi:SOS response regulatory protein OraA/RecX